MSSSPRRLWIWIALSAILLCLAGGGVWISANWPFTQAAITRTLEERFGRKVLIGSFRETWFPPGCVANDVREQPPLFSAQNVIIQAGWTGLLYKHINKIKIVGLRVTIDPAGASPMAVTDKKSKVTSVGEIEANHAILEFLPRIAGNDPTVMQIHQLVIDHVREDGRVSFRGAIKTGKPSGELTATGTLGPWKKDSPSSTPISGKYKYSNADLSAFNGLKGLLSAQGNFSGVLSRVDVDGAFDVPSFHVDDSAHSVNLMANFHATVDSHSADTVFERVQARVGRTTILASGNVSGGKGTEGKTARVQLAVNSGRVEDLLNYFSSEKHPAMTGAVRLKAYAELPPGPGFLKKVRVTGDFGVGDAKFTSATRQEPVNHLSESARGEKKDQQEEDPRTVLSNLRGHVVTRDGVATLTGVRFDFPGATAAMAGNYNLLAKTVDMKGTLQTTGTLSDTTSGFKAVVLKIATPLFKKKPHLTVVPFTLTGPSSNPKIGLDWK